MDECGGQPRRGGDEGERWKGINVMESVVIPEILKNASLQHLVEEYTDIVRACGGGQAG